MKKYLTLSDGTTFEGLAFGDHNALAAGEVPFLSATETLKGILAALNVPIA